LCLRITAGSGDRAGNLVLKHFKDLLLRVGVQVHAGLVDDDTIVRGFLRLDPQIE